MCVCTFQSEFVFFRRKVNFVTQNDVSVRGPVGEHWLNSDQLENVVRPVQNLFQKNIRVVTARAF